MLRLPKDMRTQHVISTSLDIEMAGVSRQNVSKRFKEQRKVLSRCKRYGPLRAYLNWIGKWLRVPLARLLGYSH